MTSTNNAQNHKTEIPKSPSEFNAKDVGISDLIKSILKDVTCETCSLYGNKRTHYTQENYSKFLRDKNKGSSEYTDCKSTLNIISKHPNFDPSYRDLFILDQSKKLLQDIFIQAPEDKFKAMFFQENFWLLFYWKVFDKIFIKNVKERYLKDLEPNKIVDLFYKIVIHLASDELSLTETYFEFFLVDLFPKVIFDYKQLFRMLIICICIGRVKAFKSICTLLPETTSFGQDFVLTVSGTSFKCNIYKIIIEVNEYFKLDYYMLKKLEGICEHIKKIQKRF